MRSPISSIRKFSQLASAHKKARELYAPWPYKGFMSFRMGMTKSDYPIKLRLKSSAMSHSGYLELHKWLTENKIGILSNEVEMTVLSGSIYYLIAKFRTEEDKLMFVLKFRELV